MAYVPAHLAVSRLFGTARLDYGSKMDELVLDSTTDVRAPIDIASLTIADGYAVSDGDALSIDPATASGRMSDRVSGDAGALMTTATPMLAGHRVEIAYDGVIIFQGSVTSVATELTAEPKAQDYGEQYLRSDTYTLSALEYDLLQQVVTWGFGDGSGTGDLPQEPALTRLQRWFNVDTSGVAASHMDRLNVLVDATTGDGSSTMLDQARYFTVATGVPVRINTATLPLDFNNLVVLDDAVAWTDQPLVATVTGSTSWLHQVQAKDGVPETASVIANDTRFLGGYYGYAYPDEPMGTFRLDVDRLGPSPTAAIGYLAPNPVDVLGVTCAVARITHTFDRDSYSCALELAPPKTIGV